MKNYRTLNLGYPDAINYKNKDNKEIFNKFFIKGPILDEILRSDKYFLLGDKGTGKTAYSMYLRNSGHGNTLGEINYINETEYLKFISLKKANHLIISDYVQIWKVLILLLIAKQLDRGENDFALNIRFSKFRELQKTIDTFYEEAFAPEIVNAIEMVANSEKALNIHYSQLEAGIKDSKEKTTRGSNFQINLMSLQRIFESALSSIRLDNNHIFFIDGIDIRPKSIPFDEYLECIKGLGQAAWQLNTSFFNDIKDSPGRIKVMLLLRPDIFGQLGFQNSNGILRSNSIMLNWETTYPNYRKSGIFDIADRILRVQQSPEVFEHGECWDEYFPFKIRGKDGSDDNSFISFLRYSNFRPRDIIMQMQILQDMLKAEPQRKWPIDERDINSAEFREKYSNYLLREIKDYLDFYHSDVEFQAFIKFFQYLDGRAEFTYDEYIEAYGRYANYIEKNKIDLPDEFCSDDKFLQFLYDLNIICYKEFAEDTGETFWRWSYRVKSPANIHPEIKEGVSYSIHYGLQKALNTGKKLQRERRVIKKA